MMIINRFIAIAEQLQDGPTELVKVFGDAMPEEADRVVEALYVIANRRVDQGDPIRLDEIADALPVLLEDQSVLDAAVEISIDGLVANGQSRERACLLLTHSVGKITETKLGRSELISQAITSSIDQIRAGRYRLPTRFGNAGMDGEPRYELRRLLGSGNQGTVYEAIDRVFQDEHSPAFVAIKIFHQINDRSKCLTEGKHARRIRNKHIAGVIDQGCTAEGESYLAYELIEGKPLDEWVKDHGSGLSPAQKCRIVIAIARGVVSAHAAGVIHRDIKPSNILMNRGDEPVVTDFGIAYSEMQDPRLSAYYGTRGSLAFMAPEQYDGSSDGAMPSIDIYAVGGILYWLLTDRFPNGDSVSDAIQWLEHHDGGGPARLKPFSFDERLAQIVLRALAVDPAERYQSVESLAADLEAYLSHRPIPWLDRSIPQRTLLFARRNPLLLVFYLALITLVSGYVGLRVRHQAQIRLSGAQAAHALQVQQLNSEVALKQERVEQIEERVHLARTVVDAWAKAIEVDPTTDYTSSNLLFLYSMSTKEFFKGDPELADKMLNRRIEVAEEYLAQMDPVETSPIFRAMMHEMIATWAGEVDPQIRAHHLDEAIQLIETYAPDDLVWRENIRKEGEHIGRGGSSAMR